MVKISYLYKTTVNLDYWRDYLERQLTYEEFAILKNTKGEHSMNSKIYEIYTHAKSRNLFIPILTSLHGNCIFESLKYYGLCTNISNFRKGLAMILLALKDKKYFFPDEELSLSKMFDMRNPLSYVFCKNKRRYYKYNFDAMCVDLATDSSWMLLDTELILTSLSMLLNIRIHVLRNDGHLWIIKRIENDCTQDIYFGLVDELHYIPLDVRTGNTIENKCPKYNNALIDFHRWARAMAIERGKIVREDSDEDSNEDSDEDNNNQ